MKIVHLIDYFQPKLGFQETFLALEHAKLGHKVRVVTSDRYYPYRDFINSFGQILGKRVIGTGLREEEGIPVQRLETTEIPATPVVFLWDLKRALQNINPDLVICHNLLSVTSYLVALYKKGIGYRLIYDSHTAGFNTDINGSFLKRIYNFFYKKIALPKILKVYDKIFAVGDSEQDFICNYLKVKKQEIPIIRLGVDTDVFRFSEDSRKKIRKKYNLTDQDILLVFAGKVTPRKNLELVLNALSKLGQDSLSKLLIVGNGEKEYTDKLKQINKRYIYWQDFVENNKLPGYFSAADIGIWPGVPAITMLEAMSCGLPLIIPNLRSTKYLDQSRAVVRFQEGSIESLAAAVEELTYNKQKLLSYRTKARAYIKNNLNWKKLAQKVLDSQ